MTGAASHQAGNGGEEVRGVRMGHVRLERGLVTPHLDAEDRLGSGDIGVEAVQLAPFVRLRSGRHGRNGLQHLVAVAGCGFRLSDDDQHGNSSIA